jgi:hypothetical protein
VWETSWPDASLTVRMTSTPASAKSSGTAQVSSPSGATVMPLGPALTLTPPFFDLTTGA